ncbi:glutamine-hydrolyzing GMP synthase [candidate division WOR-3 bacterium]|nr:glutamine-hydrolyzing GMP synthase [candidate division WOR-3 bacterium]
MPDKIAVIDLGGQYAHLIATKVREAGVYSEILDPVKDKNSIFGFKGIILSGSPALSSQNELALDPEILKSGIPVLGFCFGHQEIAKFHGGKIENKGQEYGSSVLRITKKTEIFAGLADEETVWMSHGDAVVHPGDMDEIGISVSPSGEIQRYSALQQLESKHFGFQFHPEVDDTPSGLKMIENFVIGICVCKKSWDQKAVLESVEKTIKEETAARETVMLVSGGVDSTVAAVLLAKFLPPERLQFIHVDTGLMRENESGEVMALFEKQGLLGRMKLIDASKQFIAKLQGVSDPEEKRKLIGEAFIESVSPVLNDASGRGALLGQGTIYPDRIETGGTQHASRIKTHHNRVPLIDEMIKEGMVVEPLKDLYKIEVRNLGRHLGIPPEFLERHPFPGPGLGVRCVCSDGRHVGGEYEKARRELLLLETKDFEKDLLPVKSVGVKGDLRSYEYTAVLCSEKQDLERAASCANIIFRAVKGVNRAIWIHGHKKVPKFSPRKAFVTAERLAILRKADKKANRLLVKHNIYGEIWQMPVILLPVLSDLKEAEIVVVRPVVSLRGMTAKPYLLKKEFMDELADSLKGNKLLYLAFDVSSKPPATIEWE